MFVKPLLGEAEAPLQCTILWHKHVLTHERERGIFRWQKEEEIWICFYDAILPVTGISCFSDLLLTSSFLLGHIFACREEFTVTPYKSNSN